ncbi:MAG: hypothetical protein Q4D29_03635 [Lachnospiraceae bacterium]|nr:hypothetical protein [Lachnospiraceae bacterium]
MKYKKKENEAIDIEFKNASRRGFNIRFSGGILFYKKGFHWEYLEHENITKIHRRIEEVITHTSCCAENMDIQKLIVTLKDGQTETVHVCDGEPRLAEKLYDDLKSSWTNVEFGT